VEVIVNCADTPLISKVNKLRVTIIIYIITVLLLVFCDCHIDWQTIAIPHFDRIGEYLDSWVGNKNKNKIQSITVIVSLAIKWVLKQTYNYINKYQWSLFFKTRFIQ
jgi:hypothetical protein